MTEESNSPSSTATSERQAQSSLLRQAREAAGLQLAALAATLKVPVERLQALEEGRYQDLPNLTFARALASSVCRTLKIDPLPVLQALPQQAGVKLGSDAPVQTVVELPRHRASWPALLSFNLRSPLVWAVILLALALALWWWLPQRDVADAQSTAAEPQAQAQGVVAQPAASPAVVAEPIPPGTPEPVTPASAEQLPAAPIQPAPAPGPVPAAAPVAAPPQLPDVAETAAAKTAQSAAGLLQLRARATTWIQLKDATGKELQQRTLQPGQTLDYDGQGPVQVVLGRASGVDVIVRGQPFDTSAFASNRVARFEVK